MFSFAGQPLADPVGSAPGAWIENNIRPQELFPLAYRYWPGDLTNGPVLEVTAEPARPAIINTLFWPFGASRFAQAHFVVSEGQLDVIRKATSVSGTSIPGTLLFSDGGVSSELGIQSAQMWMLPARPLSTAVAGAGMFLLTLVDDRYWWWGTPLQLHVSEGATTWTQLYANIAAALGISIAVGSIPAEYGKPVADYSASYRPLPNVLDAVAFSVGQRIVRSLNGVVTAQNVTTAIASVVFQLVRAQPKYAGGQFALLPG